MAGRLPFLIGVMGLLFAAPSGAADLKVISAGAVRGLIAQIIDDYARQTGQKFDFTIGTTGQLRDIIASGQPADLLIVSTPMMAELEKTGKFLPASRSDLGRVGIGVAVRDGAAVPDVATPEAFKAALVAAKSVAYTNPAEGGTSGIYFAGVAERFGIGDAIKNKAVLTRGGREAAIEVAEGRAELAIVFISEAAAVKGVKLAGPCHPRCRTIRPMRPRSHRAARTRPRHVPSSRRSHRPQWRNAGAPTASSRRSEARVCEDIRLRRGGPCGRPVGRSPGQCGRAQGPPLRNALASNLMTHMARHPTPYSAGRSPAR